MLMCRIITPMKLCVYISPYKDNITGIFKYAHRKCNFDFQCILAHRHCSNVLATNICITSAQVSKIQTLGIATSSVTFFKEFLEHENKFAYETIKMHSGTPHLNMVVVKGLEGSLNNITNLDQCNTLLDKNWHCESPSNMVLAFSTVSQFSTLANIAITDSQFSGLCSSLATNVSEFSDSELTIALASLNLWPKASSLNSPNFSCVWSALDKECMARINRWDIDTLFCFADLWYSLNLARVSVYMKHCLKRLGTQVDRLSPSQLVQNMFYVNAYRKVNGLISMNDYERCIRLCINDLTLNDLSVIAMAFFKSKTQIGSTPLLVHMLQRTTDGINTVHEIALCALLKIFRYSLPPSLDGMLYNLLDKIVPNVHRLSMLCCVHIVLAGTNLQIFHKELLKVVFQHFANNISSMRIKDIERIAFVLSLYHFDPHTTPCIYEQIVHELHKPERSMEIEKYPKCLPMCIYYLTLQNFYYDKFISKILNPQFIIDSYGDNKDQIGREILCLDLSVGIECPNYEGNRLNAELRYDLGRKFIHSSPTENKTKLNMSEKMILEVYDALSIALGGYEYTYIGNILPHFQRVDIVCGVANKKYIVVIPREFQKQRPGDVKYLPTTETGIKWLCLVIGGRNNFVRGSERPLGNIIAKMRQLRCIGYIPALIPWYEWNKIPIHKRQDYLKHLIELLC